MSVTVENILTRSVKRQYEAFPYPHYPLFAKPRWHEGWLSPSAFSAALLRDRYGQVSSENGSSEILVAGCGEILPYVLRKYESSSKSLCCVDLSQSSLSRARFRLLMDFKATKYICSDLDVFLEEETREFTHMDLFGVLHHLPNPSKTMRLLSSRAQEGATARVMVYNSKARRWIREIQKAFAVLGIDPYRHTDLMAARRMLDTLSSHCPAIDARMGAMGKNMVENDAQFVDTFLHVREANISISKWFEMFANNGFEILGVVDRYGELDDLENPLWKPPECTSLEERADDYRYENNLEFFVVKRQKSSTPNQKTSKSMVLKLAMKQPPALWFSFNETKEIPKPIRRQLWRAHINFVHSGRIDKLDHLFDELSEHCLKRLARLGCVFSSQFDSSKVLLEPLESQMEPPLLPTPVSLLSCPVKDDIERILRTKNRYSEKRVLAAVMRMERAQL